MNPRILFLDYDGVVNTPMALMSHCTNGYQLLAGCNAPPFQGQRDTPSPPSAELPLKGQPRNKKPPPLPLPRAERAGEDENMQEASLKPRDYREVFFQTKNTSEDFGSIVTFSLPRKEGEIFLFHGTIVHILYKFFDDAIQFAF